MKKKLLFLFTLLTTQFSFAQLGFEKIDIANSIYPPRDIHSVDIDNDGDMDILSYSASIIVWFENTDGNGNFGAYKVIAAGVDNVQSIYTADLDGDGDMDVLSASSNDDKIAWYENTDGQGTFGAQQIISTIANNARSVYATDLDGDGDMDVLSASEEDDKIAWYENTDGQGTFGAQQIISTIAYNAQSVYATDIDGDGDMDVLSGCHLNKIVWYENTDGQGTFGAEQAITTYPNYVSEVHASDLDGDGDMDVYAIYGSVIFWFENTDGQGTFGAQQIIGYTFSYADVYATDLDGDGDMDVLSTTPTNSNEQKIVWYENTDGQGTFSANQVITTLEVFPTSVHASDLDGDGDMEMLFTSSLSTSIIAWYENIDGQDAFGEQQVITPLAKNAGKAYPGDVDGDGDMDVISEGNGVSWYENRDGLGTFGAPKTIALSTSLAYTSDLDGDGDIDVISRNSVGLSWQENIDGQGNFGAQQIITTLINYAHSVFASDLDGDGDMDVLSTSGSDNKVVWYENTDGQGTFGGQQIITTLVNSPQSVYAIDLDGDGDIDVLSASEDDHKIAWYENTDGQGTFGGQQIITTLTNGARSVYASDLDGDGDMDVLSASRYDDKVAWYENIDGQGTFGSQQIISTLADNVQSVYATDLDDDGDMDVLCAIRDDDIIAWYENIDGQGTFGTQQVITSETNGPIWVYASDMNSDGNMDVLSVSASDNTIAWYRNIGTNANEINGEITMDTNLDGCDNGDNSIGNLLVETTDGTVNLSTFSLNSGVYQLFPDSGSFTTSIVSPLNNYYTVNPITATSNFTGIGNVDTVDFCIQPTGTYNDLNIAIYPNIDDPRPGFDTSYQIVYNNIGTTQLSGDIIFEFDDAKMQFLNANSFVTSQTSNTITFNFTNLNPFETRTINLRFNVFPPPTTNIDDVLLSNAIINPINNDETPVDNLFKLRQTVIGSYDPNDIRVLEGDQILLEDIDKYLHYIIRFQNTGTASAINVRVEHILDSKLDWTTMQLQSMSHAGRVEITDGSNVEFIFDNINLIDSTTDEPNSHGYIAFKIKPKTNVVIGDIINGVAAIYFDFNPPIITNTAMTEIVQRLSVGEFEANKILMYPNPTKETLHIQAKTPISDISIFDINGRLVKTEQPNSSSLDHQMDLKNISQGIYFIKIQTNSGIQTQKLIKE
ncbi:T9SS type A sorting domain-containing protein [Kordia jejudonensis]|uniref:T9SS type A sorting domain-containing protein n=1 Tax=Kordia jejudonensis TaxID=1348245 RepID=UPI00069AB9C9|nr:T9SS type A sorting domain-containing protein [Kordia jejudonensis]